ncbi:MAG: hypothetical protein N2578_06545 [Bdellovibrionaceae bacterium]|nr:hypothetical protein [Pseudobdellovibrionaceae bacterium]
MEEFSEKLEANALNLDWIKEFYQSIRSDISVNLEKNLDPLLSLLDTLTPEQLENFERVIEKKIAEEERDLADPGDALERQFERYQSLQKFFLGELTKRQKLSLREHLRSHPWPWREHLDHKKNLLQKFLATRSNPRARRDFVRSWIVELGGPRLASFAAALEAYQSHIHIWSIDFYRNLEPSQRQKFVKKLRSRAAEFRRISQQD